VGVSASLLGAYACGVSPEPYSHRSLRAFRSNQQCYTTIVFNIVQIKEAL